MSVSGELDSFNSRVAVVVPCPAYTSTLLVDCQFDIRDFLRESGNFVSRGGRAGKIHAATSST